jgi:hypothetical protein
MLERGHDAGRFKAAHIGTADAADQVGIFTDGLLDPPPAQITSDIQNRGKSLVDAQAAHCPTDLGGHSLDQVRVEGGAPAQRRRVYGRLPCR